MGRARTASPKYVLSEAYHSRQQASNPGRSNHLGPDQEMRHASLRKTTLDKLLLEWPKMLGMINGN